MSDDDMDLQSGPNEDWEAAAGLFLPWPASMALSRITADTPHLAAGLAAAGHVHEPGIICSHWQCVRDRQQALEHRKPCGCPSYVLCLCRKRKPGIEVTAAHHPRGCGCDECRKLRSAIGKTAGRDKHTARTQPEAPNEAKAPDPPLTPGQEIMAAIWAPLFLPEDQLPQYRPFPPGHCRECGLEPVKPGTNICWYCDAARGERLDRLPPQLKPLPAPGRIAARRAASPLARALGMAVTGFALIILSVHVPSLGLLLVPGIILLARGFIEGRRLP